MAQVVSPPEAMDDTVAALAGWGGVTTIRSRDATSVTAENTAASRPRLDARRGQTCCGTTGRLRAVASHRLVMTVYDRHKRPDSDHSVPKCPGRNCHRGPITSPYRATNGEAQRQPLPHFVARCPTQARHAALSYSCGKGRRRKPQAAVAQTGAPVLD